MTTHGRGREPEPPAPARLLAGAPLTLPKGEAHVWVLSDAVVEQASCACAGLLSDEENRRALAYRQRADTVRFSGRRGALRWLAARYLGLDAAAIRFVDGGAGKPALHPSSAQACAFSVARTEGMTLLAFARAPRIGVDVERAGGRFNHASVARGIFSDEEQAQLEHAGDDAPEIFLRTWTRKEALLKALGIGLAESSRDFSTADVRRSEPRWRAWHAGVRLEKWTCIDLALGAQYRGALAIGHPRAKLSIITGI